MHIWQLAFHHRAEKQIRQLPSATQKRMIDFFEQRVLDLPDPLILARPLHGDMAGLWRFRIGDYRVIVTMDRRKMIILALEIGHRKEIYTSLHHRP